MRKMQLPYIGALFIDIGMAIWLTNMYLSKNNYVLKVAFCIHFILSISISIYFESISDIINDIFIV